MGVENEGGGAGGRGLLDEKGGEKKCFAKNYKEREKLHRGKGGRGKENRRPGGVGEEAREARGKKGGGV